MSEQAPVPEQLTAEEQEKIVLISGNSHPQLAEDVAGILGVELSPIEFKWFPNGDMFNRVDENVRGHEAFIIQPHFPGNGMTMSDSYRQHTELIHSARNAAARRIYAIAPTWAGARQDRRTESRAAISSKITLRGLYNEGAKELITIDPHNMQALENGYPGISTSITARDELQRYVRKLIAPDIDNSIVIGADLGSAKLAARWAKDLGLPYVVYPKERDPVTDEVTHPSVIADTKAVKGKTCVIPDDMIDTAGTLISLVGELRRAEAGRLIAAATHLFLSKDAKERLQELNIEIVGTDTVPTKEAEAKLKDLHVVSIADIISETIKHMLRNESVSKQPYGQVYS